jgi:cation diffusion facilitator family transporter
MAKTHNADQVTRLKSRVTYIAAFVNIILAGIKIGFGIVGRSEALIADGIHSLSDLLSDLFVIVAIKLGSREADHDHPYGHRRFETMATVLLGGSLIVIAGGIAWDVIERILHPETLLVPDRNTLIIAVISILANEWLYQYTKRVAKQTRSKLLLANAWHHRSDAISSIVVLFGIMAVFYGYPFADAIAAVIVALMVAKIGLSLMLESIRELVDTSLSDTQTDAIRKKIKATEGVRSIHLLRTRQMGEDSFIDTHIVVDPKITVSEGHMIGDAVRDNLKAQFEDVADVLVHIDPEDDEFKQGQIKSLTRKQVQAYLKQYLAELSYEIDDFRIHYLDGKIELEIIISRAVSMQQQLVDQIKDGAARLEQDVELIEHVFVLYKL